MTPRKPRSEKRQRNKAALVRMNEAEYAALTAAMTRTGKGASTLLRDAFLASEHHPDPAGPLPVRPKVGRRGQQEESDG